MSDAYAGFVAGKMHSRSVGGVKPVALHPSLFDFQRTLIEWALETGRCGIFADCGLGKTLMQLVWADNVVRHTNRPVLLLTPLAVSAQTAQEAERFGIDARRCLDGKHDGSARILIANYERLHYFTREDFGGVVCDESSILKSFEGATKAAVTEFLRVIPYRLLCTATAAPNDYIELGTSSEALGYMGYMDMLSRFFKNDQSSIKPLLNRDNSGRRMHNETQWRLKGHAEEHFWRWVCSWSRAVRKPSDVGGDDSRFVLPRLIEREHAVTPRKLRDGELFAFAAVGLAEQREERNRTVKERCEKVAELCDSSDQHLVWCHLNKEGNLLESLIDGAVQVSGSDSDEEKEAAFLAFAAGECRTLITKPSIGAWGLNFQNCAHETYFPSHSFEQYYQAIRRCWRFGQTRDVTVDLVVTDGDAGVLANLQRKAAQADTMFASMVRSMHDALGIDTTRNFTTKQEVPSWL